MTKLTKQKLLSLCTKQENRIIALEAQLKLLKARLISISDNIIMTPHNQYVNYHENGVWRKKKGYMGDFL